MNKDILTIPQAANLCSLSRVTLWKYVKTGDLKASLTPGGQYRIVRNNLESFMRSRRMHPLATYQPQTTKILIVDDDPHIRNLFTNILSQQGFSTETAFDGFEAGVKVVSFKPGMLILDLFMPEMNGFEVCRRIKNNPNTSNIKILAITGFDSPDNRDRIMDAGADSYLTKPIVNETLIKTVISLLNVSTSATA